MHDLSECFPLDKFDENKMTLTCFSDATCNNMALAPGTFLRFFIVASAGSRREASGLKDCCRATCNASVFMVGQIDLQVPVPVREMMRKMHERLRCRVCSWRRKENFGLVLTWVYVDSYHYQEINSGGLSTAMMEVCTPSVKLVKVRYRYVFAVLLRYVSATFYLA